jgi:hypothetical protein
MPNRHQRRHGVHSHQHQGHDNTPAIVWSCPACFAVDFPQLADSRNPSLSEQESKTGMRASIAHLGCIDVLIKKGYELMDTHSDDHNRYLVFCPHEEEVSSAHE